MPSGSGRAPASGLECVVNVSEGRDPRVVDRLGASCGAPLLDVHSDPHHNRTVFTLAGPTDMVERAARMLSSAAIAAIDFTEHDGRHPAFGVVDVVPFVPLHAAGTGGAAASGAAASGAGASGAGAGRTGRLAVGPPLDDAIAARDRFARWAGSELGVACHLYGPLPPNGHRTLPELRRAAGSTLAPDTGPTTPDPRVGRCAVGARHFLVAYNLWVTGDVDLARAVAADVRGPAVRALGLVLDGRSQISCNLVDPLTVGPAEVHDEVARRLEQVGAAVERCELVGLLPAAALATVPSRRHAELGLTPERTIEARLEAAGLELA
ncbi:MAG: hypothetical protein ACRDZR_00550 [Acidimicrobiales bacterium]